MSAPEKPPTEQRQRVFKLSANRNNYRCPIAAENNVTAFPTDLHHAGMPNTVANRRAFPNVIHSIFNCVAVSHHYHMANGRWGQRKGYIWAERLQTFLERPAHSKICRWANGKTKKFPYL